MTPNLDLLSRLIRERVEFVLIGGMAGVVHGASLVTQDVDVCARPTVENMRRVLAAVAGLNPRDGRSSSAPALTRDADELASSEDVSLMTDDGRLDILWDVPGIGAWPHVSAAAELVDIGNGATCPVLRLEALIAAKRYLGRTRDLQAIDELEEIRRRRDRRG